MIDFDKEYLKTDDYEFLMKVSLLRVYPEQWEDIFIYYSILKGKYKVYDSNHQSMNKYVLSLEYHYSTDFSASVYAQTFKFKRDKKLNELLG